MTDAEKIEWLSATNKALMESQERLAGEIVELRKLAYIGDHHFPDLTWKARFDELLEENKKLRELLAEAQENHAAAVEAFHDATRLRSEIQQARIKAENERDILFERIDKALQ